MAHAFPLLMPAWVFMLLSGPVVIVIAGESHLGYVHVQLLPQLWVLLRMAAQLPSCWYQCQDAVTCTASYFFSGGSFGLL